MKITTITVTYGRTENLGDYSNVRPEVELIAELEEGDTLDGAIGALLAQARAHVEMECDAALEANNKPAKYSTDPRYQIVCSAEQYRGVSHDLEQPSAWVVAIVPEATRLPGRCWQHPYNGQRLRHAHAIRIAHERLQERMHEHRDRPERAYTLVDASDGDISQLPPEWFTPPPPKPEPEPKQHRNDDDEEDR